MPSAPWALKLSVRTYFAMSTRRQIMERIAWTTKAYLQYATELSDEESKIPVEVPALMGIDEDLRNRSFFQVLQHNTIVNRAISEICRSLAEGDRLGPDARIDPKRDVLPTPSPGSEVLGPFRESVEAHLTMVRTLGQMHTKETVHHPVFGELNSHGWNAMFAFHLRLHQRQVAAIANSFGIQLAV